ncbi:uncharacterized protein V1510DRAFT_415349 [Dipodascopsis tothii]|uniref:uncharacterized protein n=1 Tax=Dipodascopsis tothii TaxID=44089 RepID=UPI0034CF4492
MAAEQEPRPGSQASSASSRADRDLPPYILQPLLPEITIPMEEDEPPVVVTCVEAWHSSLYLGTTSGEILHFFRDPTATSLSYMFASRQAVHTSRPHAIQRILVLPTVSQALVLSHNSISFFTLPEFSPVGLGRIREVNGMSLDLDRPPTERDDEVRVTVFTRKLIRIVRVREKDVKLVRDVDYPSALTGIQRSALALVANETTYDLIDLNNVRKIPLFPICNTAAEESEGAASVKSNSSAGSRRPAARAPALEPHVAPVTADEFLVTSGSSSDEPAMGLVVNVYGDISRGTIAWSGYPSMVAVEYPYCAAVVGTELQLHSLNNQQLLQKLSFATAPILSSVTSRYTMPFPLLAEKLALVPLFEPAQAAPAVDLTDAAVKTEREGLGDAPLARDDAQVALEARLEEERQIAGRISSVSSSLFVFSAELGVQCLVPSPMLLRLDELFDEGKINDILESLDREDDAVSEQVFHELAYIRQKLSLYYFRQGRYVDAENYWYESGADPRMVISLFNRDDVKGMPWLYAGVRQTVHDIAASRPADGWPPEALMVVKHYLAGWLEKKGFESVADAREVFHAVEVAYLRVLLEDETTTKEEIYNFTDSTVDDESFADAARLLEAAGRYFALSRLYQSRKRVSDVCRTWRKMVDGEWHDAEFVDGDRKMMEYLLRCRDENTVFEYGIWLMKRNAEYGVRVFVDDHRRVVATNDVRLRNEIRKIGGEAWRLYLENMVVVQQKLDYANELVLLYTNDVIAVVESDPGVRQEVIQSYEDYRALSPPKIAYTLFLESRAEQSSSPDAIAMRLKFLHILQSDAQYDLEEVFRRIKPHEDFLVTEMVILNGKLSHHHSALHILCHSLADYDTAIAYCLYGGHSIYATSSPSVVSPDQQKELFEMLLVEFLKLKSTDERIKCTKRLLDGFGTHLDLQFVLRTIPDSWSVQLISGYLIAAGRELLREKKESLLMRGLSREENFRAVAEFMDIVVREGPLIERRR